jgi:hypothetical protein
MAMPFMMYWIYKSRDLMDKPEYVPFIPIDKPTPCFPPTSLPAQDQKLYDKVNVLWANKKETEDTKIEIQLLKNKFQELLTRIDKNEKSISASNIQNEINDIKNRLDSFSTESSRLTDVKIQSQLKIFHKIIDEESRLQIEQLKLMVEEIIKLNSEEKPISIDDWFEIDVNGMKKPSLFFIESIMQQLPAIPAPDAIREHVKPMHTQAAVVNTDVIREIIANELSIKYTTVSDMISKALDKYSIDNGVLALVDYALGSAGGKIDMERTSSTYIPKNKPSFGIFNQFLFNAAKVILDPDVNPGNCWPMSGDPYLIIGNSGKVGIILSRKIMISKVTIQHADYRTLPSHSISSAPRLISIYTESGKLLGDLEFDPSKRMVTFDVEKTPVSSVDVVIKSNWGADWTCLYRIRIHGEEEDMSGEL